MNNLADDFPVSNQINEGVLHLILNVNRNIAVLVSLQNQKFLEVRENVFVVFRCVSRHKFLSDKREVSLPVSSECFAQTATAVLLKDTMLFAFKQLPASTATPITPCRNH